MGLLSSMFTWWLEPTIGTRVLTRRRGREVGKDRFGNRYFVDRDDDRRRWVLFNGEPEASRVPAEWHGWLRGATDELPGDADERRPWEKEHVPNLTGTPEAYRPSGSVEIGGRRPPATGDYEPWRPS